MKKAKKGFDCMEMMREGALRIHEETKNMTKKEELTCWRRQNEEARTGSRKLLAK